MHVGESRRSWPRYDDNMMGRDDWTEALIKNYIQQLKLDQVNGKGGDTLSHTSAEEIAKTLVERSVDLICHFMFRIMEFVFEGNSVVFC